ncbi:SDR family oxidoreductase [Miniphocaeibacter halophilus]|uniref:NAD(P)-dependent oxidoreductase n=1 Tax=Miniphocaeibacter halophilus TaxID=2931922 RepID=A0AC61NGI3_9FIRM|nr:NAD(P)-dependent oxidoreductase [Miniphocaeibacter halophilus]QQK08993.1 NAD(P)-dependent oxidoreductase [Miniphocaeibacter halophilus]
MKIGIIAANGKAGKLITAEAVSRGLDVTAIVRGENKTEASKVITKDIFDLTYDDLKDFDVIIDAFGTWSNETFPMHSTSLRHLADILSGKDNRLLVVGGAGSLYIDKEHKTRLMDTPDFPEAFMPLATAMGKALDELRKRDDVKWTYISPAADFQADGKRTGEYLLAGEEYTTNANNESLISYADYAIAMIDEAVNGNHIQERISVLAK